MGWQEGYQQLYDGFKRDILADKTNAIIVGEITHVGSVQPIGSSEWRRISASALPPCSEPHQ